MPDLNVDDPLFKVIRIPREGVTHWGISRLDKGKPDRLECANADGLTAKDWPIEELTHDTVKARWGAGEFRIHWFESEPDHEDQGKRWRSAGHSTSFKVAAEAAATVRVQPAGAPASPVVPQAPAADMQGMFAFVTQVFQMAEQRATSQLEAASRLAGLGPQNAAPPQASADAMAAVAELRAELRARDERDLRERAHRTEIARLERERDEARRDAEEEDDEPSIVAPDGAGFIAQIGAGIANALVEAAKKNPELVMGVLGKVAEPVIAKMVAAQTAQQPTPPPPTGNPEPRQVAPAPVAPEPMTSNGMPSVPMASTAPPADAPAAASSAPAAVAAVETTKTGVPITRAPRANGAAPKAPPVTIDVAAEVVKQ